MEVIFWRSFPRDLASVIFQLFLTEMYPALVHTPFRSIIGDQIKEVEGLGLTATSLAAARRIHCETLASFRTCAGQGISQSAEMTV